MPYPGEFAGGQSLVWLEKSQVLKDFEGAIEKKDISAITPPPPLEVARREWLPKRVIAIDGSRVLKRLNNGFPGAEAGLLMVSVISIKLEALRGIKPGQMLRPSVFHDMESVGTVQDVVPGIGVIQKDMQDDSPLKFFRRKVHEILNGARLGKDHETILQTLGDISKELEPKGQCPVEGCEHLYKRSEASCPDCGETWYETDILRLHEYYDGVSSSGEMHGRFLSVLEILALLNILRYFAERCPDYFADCIFVLDGPLAVFGTPASLLRPIRQELCRLNSIANKKVGCDIALIGVEKSGMLYEHWEEIDYDRDKGPRKRFPNGTVITPGGGYIRENVKPNKTGTNHGEDTHFGRFVLYKTDKGEHVVINTAMLTEKSRNLQETNPEYYHRLGDVLDVMDHLATYLYKDGFMPLIRAHAHAAIPLTRGGNIIQDLFGD